MRGPHSRAGLVAATAVVVVYLVGIVGHLVAPLRPFMRQVTPLVLAVTGLVVFGSAVASSGIRLLLWGAVTYLGTFTLEAVGVLTGRIFGAYRYGVVLGPMLFNVPLVIGFNWVIVVLGAVMLAERMTSSTLAAAVYAGFLALVFDLVLEPVAVYLGYWSWVAPGRATIVVPPSVPVPALNFVAWFLISFVAALGYRALRLQRESYLPILYVGVQLLFFAAVLAGVVV